MSWLSDIPSDPENISSGQECTFKQTPNRIQQMDTTTVPGEPNCYATSVDQGPGEDWHLVTGASSVIYLTACLFSFQLLTNLQAFEKINDT